MITTTDIANILYRECRVFGIERFKEGNVAKGKLTGERIVVHAREPKPESTWKKSFCEVNFLVPDLSLHQANLIRLNEIERRVCKTFKSVVGSMDGTTYKFGVYSTHTEEDKDLQCHFINAKILFQVHNITEND